MGITDGMSANVPITRPRTDTPVSSHLPHSKAADTDRLTTSTPTIRVNRRTIDGALIGIGLIATLVLAVSGGLLTWGSNFSKNYVGDELSSQHISFPSAAQLTTEGRTDLLGHADHKLDSGTEAQAYASYINGHLAKIAAGATFADLGTPERAAKADVDAAVAAAKTPAEISALQAKVDGITTQRNTLFKGETLRGLLLSAYAWSTVGRIAGIAASGAFIAAVLVAILVGLGIRHLLSSKHATFTQ